MDLVAVVVRPESVDVLVGVGEEVMGTHVQVVEVVALEDWLGLAVVVLLALAVPFPEGLDDGRMPLILAEQDHVLPTHSIEGFAHAVPHSYPALEGASEH